MSRITDSARGQECQIRLSGICSFNTEQTVFAHLPSGFKGFKNSDMQGAYACLHCHDEVDRRTMNLESDFVELEFRRGVEKTQLLLEKAGLILINNGMGGFSGSK